jgi:hypothetical protein
MTPLAWPLCMSGWLAASPYLSQRVTLFVTLLTLLVA